MSFVSYAQNYEDVMLFRALRGIEHGFYVDVGAQDPVEDSVTKAFYERGWRGINIEPVQRWFERVAADRPHDVNLQVAISDEPGRLHLFEIVASGLSTTDPDFAKRHAEAGYEIAESDVPCVTLGSILREFDAREVHFLKVDCEGAETAALRGLNLDAVRPWIILVEATEPNSQTPAYSDWEPLLLGRRYHLVYQDGLNRFYVADERPELDAAFKFPPNIFDRFVRASEATVRREALDLQERLKDFTDVRRLAAAEAERTALQRQVEYLRCENERREAALGQLRQEIQRFTVDAAQARLDASRTNAELSRLRQELAVRDGEIVQLRQSTSWRLTAPLRGLRRFTRGGIRSGARLARPTLRWLVSRTWLRKPMISLIGEDSILVSRLRLFLFGARPSAGHSHDPSAAHVHTPSQPMGHPAARMLLEIDAARRQCARGVDGRDA